MCLCSGAGAELCTVASVIRGVLSFLSAYWRPAFPSGSQIRGEFMVKVKVFLEQATKAQRVSRGIALPFPDLGA